MTVVLRCPCLDIMEDKKAVYSVFSADTVGLNKQAEAVSCYRTDGCLRWLIQPMMYVLRSEMQIKRCKLELQSH